MCPSGTTNSGASAPGRCSRRRPRRGTGYGRWRGLPPRRRPGQSLLCGGAGDLEDREVPCDAAAFLTARRGAGDVVGDQDDAGFDPGVEAGWACRSSCVARVVAEGEQHAAAGVGGPGHGSAWPAAGEANMLPTGRALRGRARRGRRSAGSARSRRRRPGPPGPERPVDGRRRRGPRPRARVAATKPRSSSSRNRRDCRRSGSWRVSPCRRSKGGWAPLGAPGWPAAEAPEVACGARHPAPGAAGQGVGSGRAPGLRRGRPGPPASRPRHG